MRAKIARWSAALGRAAALLLVLETAACTTATHSRYRALQEDWQRSEARSAASDGGEEPLEMASPLERRELIRLVLERNPSLRAAQHAWRAALARYPQVTAFEDPVFGASLAPRSLDSSSVDPGYRLDLSQTLPFPGKLRLRGEAALAEAEAASHDGAAVRVRLAAMASVLFDDYTLAARSLEVNAAHVTLLEDFQRIAAARYEAGEASQQDPIQADVELAHALHRQVVLETTLRITGEQINALLHRRPSAVLPPPPARTAVPDESAGDAEELVAQALESRPELAAAAARVAAEEARVDLAWRDYFPDLAVMGAYDRIWQEEELQVLVGVQLPLPLQLGRRRAAVEEARARLEQVRSAHLAVEDEVRLSVQSGALRLDEARHIVHLFRSRLLPAALDQIQAARTGFETGQSSFLALIDAERNLLDVELGHEEALADLGRRRAELDQAVGRVPGLAW
jgi:outer membrane protein TolC